MINHNDLTEMPGYNGQIQYVGRIPEREGTTVPASEYLPEPISSRLEHDLYQHQAEGLDALQRGEHVTISTGTSSGKTLVYALHIARNYLEDPSTRALLIYPTKALTRDQETELTDLYERLGMDIEVGVYDGDTPSEQKQRIRETSNVVTTNFVGLNHYLNQHTQWDRILSNLEVIAIDESHQHRGIQGMHAAWITRRLLRIAGSMSYDSDPQFVLTSATIGNPDEHSGKLTGRDVTVIDEDTSPRGKREVVFWDQTERDSDDEGWPSHKQSSEIMAFLTENGMQSLQFVRSRKLTELNRKWTKEILKEEYEDRSTDVDSYNAGHTKDERRELEEDMKDGNVDGISSTSALEMGINIGSLEATILDGYPGSRIQFWQRVGRSGRGEREALSVLVTKRDPLDQFVLYNPDHILTNDVEEAVIDLTNNGVFAQHVLAAADEIPLTKEDKKYFGERLNTPNLKSEIFF